MRFFTKDDFIDLYTKLKQRGNSFIFSKFTFNKKQRSISAFDTSLAETSNWWIIPMVKERWNKMMTGNAQENFKQYILRNYIQSKSDIRLLSLGSGTSKHELELAAYPQIKEIVCVDINQPNLDKAKNEAYASGLANMNFICSDVDSYEFPTGYFDIVMFNNSLHHFDHVNQLVGEQVKRTLKQNGFLIINEYTGPTRLQYPKEQIKSINIGLQLIPKLYRRRYKTNLYKNKYYGSGLFRMILADPSECIDSANILPCIHKHFSILEEKTYGGSILMGVLKDISHHFVEIDQEKEKILRDLFLFEDEYLQNHRGDFTFGIYVKE